MLCYRVRLGGPVGRLISVRVGPLQESGEMGPGLQRAMVSVRFTRAGDPTARVHKGWLYTSLDRSSRLQVAGCQADGTDLLLSIRPFRLSRGPEAFADRFRLPFRFESWGTSALQGGSLNLTLVCRAAPGGLLLLGRVRLLLQTDTGLLVLLIPFARLLPMASGEGLTWRTYGGVVALQARVAPGGIVEGELEISAHCEGRPVPVAAPAEPPVALWRELVGEVGSLAAEWAGPGRAVVSGQVELDLYWIDPTGRSRWTGRLLPFSALLELPGLQAGDKLEPVAQIDRLQRVGDGEAARVILLVAVGLTALRPVVQPSGGLHYRLEQVVGEPHATVRLDEPLRPAERAAGPTPWRRRRSLLVPTTQSDSWDGLRLAQQVPPGAEEWGGRATEGGTRPRTAATLSLDRPVAALLGVDWQESQGRAHLLLRQRTGELQYWPVAMPQRRGDDATALAVTAYGWGDQGEGPLQIRVEVEWQ